MDSKTDLRFQVLDTKNEIDRVKLIISSIKVEMGYCNNKTKLSKLKNKRFYMERRLRQLSTQKTKLEKEYSATLKADRKEEW